MSATNVAWSLPADLLAGAAAVAVLAAFVALNPMRGVTAVERGARWWRRASASMALGTGAWSAHFIVMSGESLPGAPGYQGLLLFAAFGLTVAGALFSQALLAGPACSAGRLAGAALTLGSVLCATPVVAMLALQGEPAVAWDRAGLAAAWLLAGIGAGAALALGHVARPAQAHGPRHRPLLATLLMGATVVTVDVAVVCSARLPANFVASPVGQVGGEALTMLALLAGPAVLALLLSSSLLEDHLHDLLARARAEMQRATYTDALTRLPNRLLFEERLQRAVHRADRAGRCLALLFVNLDGFKGVNETFGQDTGDALLRVMGQRLCAVGRDLLARAGGDEFLLLLDDDPDAAEASRRAAQVLDEIARPCRIEQREVLVRPRSGSRCTPSTAPCRG